MSESGHKLCLSIYRRLNRDWATIATLPEVSTTTSRACSTNTMVLIYTKRIRSTWMIKTTAPKLQIWLADMVMCFKGRRLIGVIWIAISMIQTLFNRNQELQREMHQFKASVDNSDKKLSRNIRSTRMTLNNSTNSCTLMRVHRDHKTVRVIREIYCHVQVVRYKEI
jgi:hypothetical protein